MQCQLAYEAPRTMSLCGGEDASEGLLRGTGSQDRRW